MAVWFLAGWQLESGVMLLSPGIKTEVPMVSPLPWIETPTRECQISVIKGQNMELSTVDCDPTEDS